MNRSQIFSTYAETASSRYSLLNNSFKNIFNACLNDKSFGTESLLKKSISDAYNIAQIFLDTERIVLRQQSEEIAVMAAVDVNDGNGALSRTIRKHIEFCYDFIIKEILIQIERDIAYLRKTISNAYLQVSAIARANNITFQNALIRYRIGSLDSIKFFFHDRRNQKWSSKKFIRSAVRHHMLSLYNDAVFMLLSEKGISEAYIKSFQPNSYFHGQKITLTNQTTFPTYDEIKAEAFHPNSDSILVKEME